MRPGILIYVPVGLLQPGTNVIAGQTHVNCRATPNLSFKLTPDLTTLLWELSVE